MAVELETLVSEFSAEMLNKLQEKKSSGWRGWNWKCVSKSSLEHRLLKHVDRAIQDPAQWIDVANFCAFLWWRARQENRDWWQARHPALTEPAPTAEADDG